MQAIAESQPPGSEDIKLYKRLARTQIAPETAGKERYKNRRLLALYFDMSAMRPADQLRALTAAEQFHPHANDHGRPGFHHALSGRIGRYPAGLHRRSQPAAEHSCRR